MATLNVSKRGSVTPPGELLRHLGVQPGEKIELTLLPDRQIRCSAVRPANPARPKGSIDDFIGCLEEINEATAKAAADKVMASLNR